MKNEQINFFRNENILRGCIAYLNCKDLSRISCVCKTFYKISKNFNHYWRDLSDSYYCSNINNPSKNSDPNISDHSLNDEYFFGEQTSLSTPFNFCWKNFIKNGVQIRNDWFNLERMNYLNDPVLYEDINIIKEELYSKLKEYYTLPKLRKENLLLESEINTPLQTYLFDFLYQQQDLYDYYDAFFANKNYKNSKIQVRCSELPLADSLENFHLILKEFNSDNEYELLSKMRWYIIKNINEDMFISNDK